VASIKVFDPVPAPASLVEDLQELRAQLEQALQETERLRQENQRLRRELDRAKADLEAARGAAKPQAAPSSKGPPDAHPRTPGRKRGSAHGRHGHRPAPPPERIDETLDAPWPDACPDRGGSVRQAEVATPFRAELPRRPIIRQFTIRLGRCCAGGKRLQRRRPLQTSDALGAAACRVGPDAQAAIAVLNEAFGLAHAKIAAVFDAPFGIELTRGAGAQITRGSARRPEAADREIRREVKAAGRLTPDETGGRVAGESAWLHARVAERVACHAVDGPRKADALQRVIGLGRAGKMTHDGYPTYGRFAEAVHQRCPGHILRRLRELEARAKRGAVPYPRLFISCHALSFPSDESSPSRTPGR
jgi:transposase